MLYAILLFFSFLQPWQAYAVESGHEIEQIQKLKRQTSYSILYNGTFGTEFLNFHNFKPSNLSGAYLNLSGSSFGLRGRYSKHELVAFSGNTGFGLFRHESRASGFIDSNGLGSSNTLFDEVSLQTSLNIRTIGLGASAYFSNPKDRSRYGSTSIFTSLDKNTISHLTILKAGAINSIETERETFRSLSFGYQQAITIFQIQGINSSLNFSRSITWKQRHFRKENFRMGLKFAVNPFLQQTRHVGRSQNYKSRKKIRILISDGAMFASGKDQQNTDGYNVETEYSATFSPETNDATIQLLNFQRGNFVYGPEIEYKEIDLDQRLEKTNFLGRSYDSKNQSTIKQSSLGFRGEYTLSDRDYITFGSAVGHGRYKSTTTNHIGSNSSIREKEGDLFLLNLSLGIGQVFPINHDMNFVLETSLSYMDGGPFGVEFKSHELKSRIGIEFPFRF